MSKKRRVVRFRNAYELSSDEQEAFVDDVAGWIDGTGIRGRFIECNGNGMIEWEGEDDVVDDKVEQVLADDRVSDDPEDQQDLQDTFVDTADFEKWYGHADGSDAQTVIA